MRLLLSSAVVMLLIFSEVCAQMKLSVLLSSSGVGNTDIQVLHSRRDIALTPELSYTIRCGDSGQTVNWFNGDELVSGNPPSNANDAAVYTSIVNGNIRQIHFQNFSATFAGDYTCKSPSANKTLGISARNPSVIINFESVNLIAGLPTAIEDITIRVLASGTPAPQASEVSWWQNDTIPIESVLPFLHELNALPIHNDSGKYTVTVATSSGVTNSSFIVNVGVQPILVVTASSDAVLGEMLTLECEDLQGQPPPDFSWEICSSSSNCRSIDEDSDSVTTTQLRTNTSLLIIPSVKIIHKTTFRCVAENPFQRAVRNLAVAVSLPAPTVSLTTISSGREAGEKLELNCAYSLPALEDIDHRNLTVQYTWKKGGVNLSTGSRITTESFESFQKLVFSSASVGDTGIYSCEVGLTANFDNSITSSSVSEELNIVINAPDIITLAPSESVILDAAPYNSINFTCTVLDEAKYTSSNKTLKYSWHNGSTLITNNTDGVTLSSGGQDNETWLALVATVASSYRITCRVVVMQSGEELFMVEDHSQVNVRGPELPLLPENIIVSNRRYNRVTITIDVSRIAYTPEKYKIVYGKTQGQLNMQSEVIQGNSDITAVNEVYNIPLVALQQDTTYYYRLVIANSKGNITTPIHSFTTPKLVLMQVRAGPFQVCQNGQAQQAIAVSAFFKTAVANAINSACSCGYTEENLINDTVLCPSDDSHDLIYRAFLGNIDGLSSNQVLGYVDGWIMKGPRVTTGFTTISFQSNCPTSVSTSNEEVCEDEEVVTSTGSVFGNTTEILIVTVIGAIVIFMAVIIMLLVCMIFYQQRQIRSHRGRRRAAYKVTRRASSVCTADNTGASDIMLPIPQTNHQHQPPSNWNKSISITNCPAYGTAYAKINEAHQDRASYHDQTPCIYDSIPDVYRAGKVSEPRAIGSRDHGVVNRMVVGASGVMSDEEPEEESTGGSGTGGSAGSAGSGDSGTGASVIDSSV